MDSRPNNEIDLKPKNENEISIEEKEKYPVTPLEKHIRFFGGGLEITRSSVKKRNKSLGDGWVEANANAAIVSGLGGATIHGCPFAMFYADEAVGTLNHTHHTGIYNFDGTINEEVWNELCTYAQPENDNDKGSTLIIKESVFYQFLTERRRKENATDYSGKIKSDGEWEKYWRKFGVNMTDDRYVTLSNLRIFFEDSAKVGEEVERRYGNVI